MADAPSKMLPIPSLRGRLGPATRASRLLWSGLALWLAWIAPRPVGAQNDVHASGGLHTPATEEPTSPPELATRALKIAPLERLPPALEGAGEALEALRAWNRRGNLPLRNGFTRPLEHPRSVRITSGDLPARGERPLAGGLLIVEGKSVSWLAAIEVEAAHALRARLRVDSLPEGVEVWTRGAAGEVLGPFGGADVGADGALWLPPVAGPRLAVEVRAPLAAVDAGGVLALRIEEVVELVDPGGGEAVLSPKAATACEIDGRCVEPATLAVIDDFRHAVARLLFSESGFSFLCSGALINDSDPSTDIPYLLTANHCFSTQEAASSLVATFDYFPATCNGTPPSLGSLPTVSGSTLLATSPQSDFTLVRLSALPAGFNYFLGWTTRLLADGEGLYMLSHPEGRRQAFSASGFEAIPAFLCTGAPTPDFLYSHQISGSTLGGSSGAPAIVPENGGQIVGQLLGACLDPSVFDDCDYDTFSEVDGAFRTTFEHVEPWLVPEPITVAVDAADRLAGEPSDGGAFRIHRSGGTALPLEVGFTLGGSASAGADYSTIASPATIPAGASSVDLSVTPVDDADPEPDEDVVLTLAFGVGYEVGSPGSATVILADDDGADDCGTVAVSGTTLGGAEDRSACARLDAGPDLTLAEGAEVGLYAGRSVVLRDGFSVLAGASLRVGTCGQDLCATGASTTPLASACHPCVAQVCAADSFCCESDWDTLCVAKVGSVCGLQCP